MSKRNEKLKQIMKPMIERMILEILVFSPLLLGFWIILSSRGPITSRVWEIGLFLAGITGVIIMVRREIPMPLGSTRGKWAIIQGLFLTIFCWGIAIYSLIIDLKVIK